MESAQIVSSRRLWGLGRICAVAAVAAVAILSRGSVIHAQVSLDICGCTNNPASLGDVDAANLTAAQQQVMTRGFRTLDIKLPPDGVLVFDSLNLRFAANESCCLTVTFTRSVANSPATLLVKGNVTIPSSVNLQLSGEQGTDANSNVLGTGGRGGPGGFRGNDGAYQLVNFATIGGTGLGPGGGAGATTSHDVGGFVTGFGAAGTFVGATDLLPLIGGSGGGGGASTSNAPGCAGGGGGGGGGALLIAANGTIQLDGTITADGGRFGSLGGAATCSSYGGPGSGGAVRLLAYTIQGAGNIYARGGQAAAGPAGVNGAIRLEALNNTLTVGATTPLATRAPGPGPIVNVITPTVAITSVGGQPVPSPPQGGVGIVDLVLPIPGSTSVALTTSGVPTGTTVNVTVKPRVGGAPVTTPVTLTSCDPNGVCLASVSFDLAAGAYFVEARATFQTP
ncbi:MAG: hypothetical protein JWL71_2019 [Acidobacteria bacterium]|nr:hypothetical protein [Acidobacteriota bacterium]